MTDSRVVKFKTIAALCTTGTEAWEIEEAINASGYTARTYADVMVKGGVLSVEKVKTTRRGCPWKQVWTSVKTELTNEDIERLIGMITKSNRTQKERFNVKLDAEKKASGVYYSEQVQQAIKSDEAKGIYRLSTQPSNEFITKMKATQHMIAQERKSARAHVSGASLSVEYLRVGL